MQYFKYHSYLHFSISADYIVFLKSLILKSKGQCCGIWKSIFWEVMGLDMVIQVELYAYTRARIEHFSRVTFLLKHTIESQCITQLEGKHLKQESSLKLSATPGTVQKYISTLLTLKYIAFGSTYANHYITSTVVFCYSSLI